ncbi:hypothetical protein GWO43_04685 [candidate division KSB1 bacterium]|nr:hypothetical protein [candidate division KSB1 bacterium]NIR71212.1 hypothetical protein [candidate division KSB1 bacterium]NIS23316.1 hypothetical protein [candidate division KSB1 bacterium]NIT70195.1 hypothetical protein [candidate division KSB1 bacterium]NIU23847.1 hypothetical protein [candidate division KSB1 bacterium]
MQDYIEAVRGRVCAVCIDGIFDGKQQFVCCGLPDDRTCPIEVYLPEVINVVESIDSPRMEDYVNVLRDNVCSACEQTEDGKCELRLHADCALNRYFMLVAGAIEEVRSQQAN